MNDAIGQSFTQNQAAKYLGISPAMMIRIRNEGRIPYFQISRSWIRYKKSDLDAFLDSCYVGKSVQAE